MIIDPATLDRRGRNALMNGLVAPRPIALVSTVAADGTRNLAPFSFFNAFSFDPPTVGVGPGSRDGVNKDSLANLRATGEMVINLVDRALAEAANACSGEFASGVDEWEVSGLQPAPSELVAPSRVARAPAALECVVRHVLELGEGGRAGNGLVVAAVVRIHVADRAIDGGVPNPDALDLVGRLGGDEWCTTRDRFTLARPASRDPSVVSDLLGTARETASRD